MRAAARLLLLLAVPAPPGAPPITTATTGTVAFFFSEKKKNQFNVLGCSHRRVIRPLSIHALKTDLVMRFTSPMYVSPQWTPYLSKLF
jgi:hypothetical protein